jgi:uncharacterized membrane protein YvbJ
MAAFSHCIQCGRRLRDAVFCPQCGMSACCWKCQAQHAVGHKNSAATAQSPWNNLSRLVFGNQDLGRPLSSPGRA